MRHSFQRRYSRLSYVLLVAIGVVVVLFLQNRSVDIELHGQRLQTLTDLRRLDAQLDRDVLKVSYFILDQFDPLVATTAQLRELALRMRAPATGFAADTDPVVQGALAEALTVIEEKLRYLEKIKSLTALLRNSLQYLPLAVTELGRSDPVLAARLTRLLNRLYLYYLFPGDADLALLRNELDGLSRAAEKGRPSELVSSTLVHVRADLTRLALLADLRQRYAGVPSEARSAALFTAYGDFHAQRDRRSEWGSLALLVTTVLLFILLGLGMRRLGRAHDETAHASRSLRDAVESLSEAFALFDSGHRLVLHNQKYLDFYPWLHGKLAPGMPLAQILDLNRASAALTPASREGAQDVLPALAQTRSYPQELRNGRCYLASDSWGANGGIACVRVDITERKHTEDALQESYATLHSILETTLDGFWCADMEGRLLDVNPAYSQQSGYLREELLGLRISDLDAMESHDFVPERIQRLVERGRDQFETRHRRKDGSIWPVEVNATYNRIAGGRIFVFLRDITARKQAEETLRKLSTAVEHSSAAVVITDLEGAIQYVNPRFTEVTGYTSAEAIGQNPRILRSERTPREIYAELWGKLTNGLPWKGELLNRRKNGEHYWEETNVAPVKNEDGVATHYVAMKTEITERRQAEQTLAESETRLRTLIRAIPDLVWLKDVDGVYQACNPRFERFFGASEQDVVGRTDYDFVSPELADFFREKDRVAMRERRTCRNEEWVTFADDGHRELLETSKTPMLDAQGRLVGVLGIGHDISQRKQYEDALKKSEARFRDLFEKNSSVMLLVDPHSGAIVDANASAAAYYGYPKAQLIGMFIRDLNTLPPECIAEEMQLALGQKRNYFNFTHRLASGEIRDVEVHSTPIESDGKALLFSILHDSTLRRELERKLRDSEELHRALFLTMAEGVMVVNRAGDILAFNEAALKICQISAEDFIRHQTRFVRPDGSPLPLDQYPSFRAGRGERLDNEVHEVIRSDGTHGWHSTSSRPLQRHDEAEPYAAVVSFSVITGLVEAERSLQLAQSVFESASEGIMVADAGHHFITVNPAFSRITGYRSDEVVGEDLSLLAAGEEARAFFHAMWQRMLHDGHWEGELSNRRKDGVPFVAWLKISLVAGPAGLPRRYVALISDVTDRKLKAEALWRQANFDPLTGLPNRKLLEDRLQRSIAQAHRKGSHVGLLFIDLDRFKPVNDRYGHAAGDELLCQVARRLESSLREEDTLARLGGDEFVAILPDLPLPEAPQRAAEKVVAVLSEAFCVAGQRVEISCSVGIARFPQDAASAEALIGSADAAMYRAKEAGRGGWRG